MSKGCFNGLGTSESYLDLIKPYYGSKRGPKVDKNATKRSLGVLDRGLALNGIGTNEVCPDWI